MRSDKTPSNPPQDDDWIEIRIKRSSWPLMQFLKTGDPRALVRPLVVLSAVTALYFGIQWLG
ncbi:hypothetical protein [Deinococcus sp.]|uniref:hypothetical protein n=1 Tax=Deinococcus sp. TaxID=47478 RepID=UPI003B5B3E35